MYQQAVNRLLSEVAETEEFFRSRFFAIQFQPSYSSVWNCLHTRSPDRVRSGVQ
jgi:hypothetical protein